MNEIKVKCPTCGKVLRLAETPDIGKAVFTCPVCNNKHVVGRCQRIQSMPSAEETQYAGSAGSNAYGAEETRIAGRETGSGGAGMQNIGHLVDAAGRNYQLRCGVNTIGRQANTSSATVQIQTPDLYMSRNHAVIEVRTVSGRTVYLLKNSTNKNPSYMNGSMISAGDQLVLNDGDRMKFGNTELIFKL